MSEIFKYAAEQWREMRWDYMSHTDREYNKALEACAGVLVNKQGQREKVDGYSLWTGTTARARKYASEELLTYWEKHPRMGLERFEQLWFTGQHQLQGAAA